eukprot:1532747-Pyramimonas_sp.AAC.1
MCIRDRYYTARSIVHWMFLAQLPRLTEIWAFITGMMLCTIIIAGIVFPYFAVLSVALLVTYGIIYSYYGAVLLDMQRLNLMVRVQHRNQSFALFLNSKAPSVRTEIRCTL